MACPTCDHTMQGIGGAVPRTFWCPRCGTLKQGEMYELTMLVPRVRSLLDRTTSDDLAWQLGVTESVGCPGKQRRCADMEGA